MYTLFLNTLPRNQFQSGMAEVYKHGLIADAAYWKSLTAGEAMADLGKLIERSISIKKEIVEKDPTEQGLRKVLNFGHTIGHAIETYSLLHSENPLLHGEAIAVGMVAEAYLSATCCGLPLTQLEEITQCLTAQYKEVEISETALNYCAGLMRQDKKNSGGQIRCSLLTEIGKSVYDVPVKVNQIEEAFNYYRSVWKS